MTNYYLNLNVQSNGDYEVHKETCHYYYLYKDGNNFVLLGAFYNEIEAVKYAKRKYPNYKIDGCAYCCKKAHTS
ncbi:MAG: hypothetical protein K2G03_02790 [Bacilli bacterium]|nr:hypothetical protein [Bacilli bacterium]